MATTLHITNGDSAAALMREGGIEGDILPWRDVLHDGPVPECADLAALSQIRARFISDRGWAEHQECLQSFVERDSKLAAFDQYEKVCLWFEHDLYDQLQILQVLDYLHCSHSDHRHVELICVDRYLGLMEPREFAGLGALAKVITPAQYALATMAWQAFGQSTPKKWDALLERDLSPLTFLEGAVVRLLEEYPELESGLGRTERQIMTPLVTEATTPGNLFANNQSCEDRIFMGDNSFGILMEELMSGSRPLIEFENGEKKVMPDNRQLQVHLTEDGRAVLSGEQDRMQLHYPERWMGGVRLHPETPWRWDASISRIRSVQ